jgi:prevent-host-death family protein
MPLSPLLVKLVKELEMQFVNLYEAKTRLSALVEQAAAGEEIIIAKNGVARARLVPIAARTTLRQSANALHVSRIADDFDAPDPVIVRLFAGGDL